MVDVFASADPESGSFGLLVKNVDERLVIRGFQDATLTIALRDTAYFRERETWHNNVLQGLYLVLVSL